MTDIDPNKCAICGTTRGRQVPHPNSDYGRFLRFACATCGDYDMSNLLRIRDHAVPLRSALSGWIRDKKERGEPRPLLDMKTIAQIARSLPNYGPLEKQRALLRAIARKSRFPGDKVSVYSPTDYPLAWAVVPEEFEFYFESLVKRELVETFQAPSNPAAIFAVVTPSGWEHLDTMEREGEKSEQAFIAMRFADEYESAWENGIRPAVANAGYTAVRIDKLLHSERIDAKIISEIRRSRFVIADASEPNAGVYYEAGYAHGQGKTVLWTCKKECVERLHFDTRQYPHILWETPEQLHETLYDLICAVIGKRT